MDIIADIITYKRNEDLPRLKRERPLAELRARAALAPRPRDFRAALAPGPGRQPRLIAEIKRAMPAKGVVVRGPFDPAGLAATYAANGAVALAVTTDARYCQGSMAHLEAARAECGLPVLRHDFIIDEYQLVEARAGGADAVLLIAGVLSRAELRRLSDAAERLHMTPLVAAHDEAGAQLALAAGARSIVLDNRDLHTYAIDLAVAERLRPLIPPGVCVVAASGLRTPGDVDRMQAAGVDAVLVGEAFLRARPEDRARRVREMAGE